MALIHFTEEDISEFLRDPVGRDPAASEESWIGSEEASDCEGVRCGERLELVLPPEEYAAYIGIHGERGPLGPHSHMVLYGERPARRRRYYAVIKTGAGQ
jgi:hypothetical protein